MCMNGLIANISDNSMENKHRINDVVCIMLYHMAGFNRDGTGLGIALKDGYISYTKTAENGQEWAPKVEIDKNKDVNHVLMHTRMATHGPVAHHNSHPFETSFGIMSQNGWNSELYQKHKSQMHTECDSEALAYIFDPDMAKFDAEMSGAEHFSIVHLSKDGKTAMLINKNKSMYEMYSKKLSANVCCTSRHVLIEVLGLLKEEADIQEVSNGTVLTFEDGLVKREKFKFKERSYYQGFSYGNAVDLAEWDVLGYRDHYNKPKKHLSKKERKRLREEAEYEKLFRDYIRDGD